MQDSGFRVQDLALRISFLGFRIKSFGLRVLSLGPRFQGIASTQGIRDKGLWFKVQG